MVGRSAVSPRGFRSDLPMASDWMFYIECLAPGGYLGPMREVLALARIILLSPGQRRHRVVKPLPVAIASEAKSLADEPPVVVSNRRSDPALTRRKLPAVR
jgi:hypothetical protein